MSRIEREGRAGEAAFDDAELDYLRALATRYGDVDAAVARIAEIRGELTLPKGSVHVFSDVHGESKKLRHVINNASGRLRPLVEALFGDRLAPEAIRELLSLVYYPQETLARVEIRLADAAARRAFVRTTVDRQLEIFRALGREHTLRGLWRVVPEAWRELVWELLLADAFGRPAAFVDAVHDALLAADKSFDLVRWLSRAIRNVSVDELVVAGDLGDRGPRLDKVVDYLMRQPSVAVTWGNHDVSWMGAALGHEALIATVVRISLRYGRIAQLEQGYGIPLAPLEELARRVYGEDPAERFAPKAAHLEDPRLVARMQKAIAVVQMKLEAEVAARNPSFQVDDRQLLRAIDPDAGTVRIEGRTHALLDRRLPTLDPAAPDALTPVTITRLPERKPGCIRQSLQPVRLFAR